jgi:nucleoside-diphosphate-sugar epimerase
VQRVIADGGFTGVVHAIGMLFEGDLNKFASGSGSIPSAGATYDDITRQTAFNAIDAAVANGIKNFGFVSAAEARWDFDDKFVNTPVEWLHRYLIAKRAVEGKLSELSTKQQIRPVIVRPSLIWTWEKPGALPPVAAFTIGNALGIPFVDKPVRVFVCVCVCVCDCVCVCV